MNHESSPALVAAELIALPDDARAALRSHRLSWGYHATWLLLSLAILAAAMLLDVLPDGNRVALPIIGRLPEVCGWKLQTGMPCAGCGLTRSFIALARGDVAAAWHYNPGGLLLFGILLYQIPYRLTAIGFTARGLAWRGHSTRVTGIVVVAVAVVLLVQWIVRLLSNGGYSI